MWYMLYRTVDGRFHSRGTYASREDALAYLRRAAEECRASNHRRVEFDEDEGVLTTEYGGGDDVVTFIVDDDEMEMYEGVLS